MDKFDFINRIIALYPHAIKDHEAQYDTYKRALAVSEKVDYDEVYNLFCKEHKENFPPSPGQINDWANRCRKVEYTGKTLLNFTFRNTETGAILTNCASDIPMTVEQALKWIKTVSHTDNWEVLEVY